MVFRKTVGELREGCNSGIGSVCVCGGGGGGARTCLRRQ